MIKTDRLQRGTLMAVMEVVREEENNTNDAVMLFYVANKDGMTSQGGVQRSRLCLYRSATLQGRVDRWMDAAENGVTNLIARRCSYPKMVLPFSMLSRIWRNQRAGGKKRGTDLKSKCVKTC